MMIVIQTGVQYLRAVSSIESGHQAIWWVAFGLLLSLPAAIDAEFTLEALPHYHHLLTIRIHFPIIVSDSRRPSYHCQDSYFCYLVLIYARAQTITAACFTISEEHVNITRHSEAKYMIGEAHVNCKHKSTATVCGRVKCHSVPIKPPPHPQLPDSWENTLGAGAVIFL